MKQDKKTWVNPTDKPEPRERSRTFSTMTPSEEKKPTSTYRSGKPGEKKTWDEKKPFEKKPFEKRTWSDKPRQENDAPKKPEFARKWDGQPQEGRTAERKPFEKKIWTVVKPRVSYPVRVQPKKKIKEASKMPAVPMVEEAKAMPDKTDWQDVAHWYNTLVGVGGSEYHQKVLLPGVERMLKEKNRNFSDMKILDLACGQGVLCRRLAMAGASVTGVDLAEDLLAAAKTYTKEGQKRPIYMKGDATNLVDEMGNLRHGLQAETYDAVTLVLSVQNMNPITGVWQGVQKLLKPDGVLILVMMHPCFRIPQRSDWLWQQRDFRQNRILWRYLSSEDIRIAAHPGKEAIGEESPATIHFHRPLQAYMNTLGNAGLLVEHCEEWVSHKKEQQGPKKEAMDLARQEFPMFLALRCRKVVAGDTPASQEERLECSILQSGNLLANGIDVVSVARVETALQRLGEAYVKQMLTEKEWQYWQEQGYGLSAERLAGRWAAKEAVVKALGTGFMNGVTWKNVEILHDEQGAPHVHLYGDAAKIATDKGILHWLVSISHEKQTAMALVQALSH